MLVIGKDWMKSTRSNSGQCLEAKRSAYGVHIRNSNRPEDGVISVRDEQWSEFIAIIKNGELDLS